MRSQEPILEPTFSIGEAARILGVSEPTLRLYERRGLILVRKSPGNQRQYSHSDLQRLRCIRKAIHVMKISIEGIRRIQSMIPCWKVVHCPADRRLSCPAYACADAGCWTFTLKDNACKCQDCKSCPVYLRSGDCLSIKTLLQRQLALTIEPLPFGLKD
jgi:MerR family transcriptional regulator/heat shock protein HspR